MRLQLALNVTDLEAAVAFYSRLFSAEPARLRPGYANFAIDEPPLKLVLFETGDGAADTAGCCGVGGTINHLGVETETAEQVVDAERRMTVSGLETTGVDDCAATRRRPRPGSPTPTAPGGSGTCAPVTARSSRTWWSPRTER